MKGSIRIFKRAEHAAVTAETIASHLESQQEHAIARGLINRRIPKRRLVHYAAGCASAFQSNLRECQNQRDIAMLNRAFLRRVKDNGNEFLHANWKGSTDDTLEALR